ncbi:Mitochondrial intermediate peptidase [Blattella germanica]|nr:Mitochondrial intermediate peptidase [Blattella germanica]
MIFRQTRNLTIIKQWGCEIKSSVSTWSPLAKAFNAKPDRKLNLSLVKEDVGLFGISHLRSHEGFYALKEQGIWEVDKLIAEACSVNRSRKMVEVFDELSDTLCKVADLAEFIRIGHPQAAYTHAAEDACITISGVVEKLNTHRELYSALREVVDSQDKFPTSAVDEHVARLFLFDFEQCGIHLPETDRRKVVALNDSILQLGQSFMAGAVAPRSIPKDYLPQYLRDFFSADGNQILVTGLYSDSPNSMAREAAYRIFLHPDKHQDYLLTEMLKEKLQPRAEADFSVMRNKKMSDDQQDLSAWDVPYYIHKVRNDWLQVNNSEFSPYFSLGACMEGLNMLMNKLYNISLVNDEILPGETWASDVYKLAESLWTYNNPIVVLMLNLPVPRWSSPTLLTSGMVDNLFHEMGHAMHSMLARTDYQHVTGTRCTTDFAEVPSVLMEFFAADPRAWQLRFSHLVGYGAKYYSYLLSRAVAAWIWQTYFEADPMNSSAGERYRSECLAHGGGKPARELVSHFLRREVTPGNLANSLISEIDNAQDCIKRLKLKSELKLN